MDKVAFRAHLNSMEIARIWKVYEEEVSQLPDDYMGICKSWKKWWTSLKYE